MNMIKHVINLHKIAMSSNSKGGGVKASADVSVNKASFFALADAPDQRWHCSLLPILPPLGFLRPCSGCINSKNVKSGNASEVLGNAGEVWANATKIQDFPDQHKKSHKVDLKICKHHFRKLII